MTFELLLRPTFLVSEIQTGSLNFCKQVSSVFIRDCPRPDLGPNIDPFPIKNEQKLPKMVYIIPNVLVLHFGGNFMKIGAKKAKLQIHENLHKNVNENKFSFTFSYKFS